MHVRVNDMTTEQGEGGGDKSEQRSYPCVVEFCLHTNHVPFLFVLGSQDL
jgi:hypothetical protein